MTKGNGRVSTLEKPVDIKELESLLPETPVIVTDELEWKRRNTRITKTTITRCIIISKDGEWIHNAPVDLKGRDMSDCTWGYYGQQFPVLIQHESGELKPFIISDYPDGNCNRLYKAANPEGYRAAFKHKNTLLQKLQLGMMAAIVGGLFFMMFVLVNN